MSGRSQLGVDSPHSTVPTRPDVLRREHDRRRAGILIATSALALFLATMVVFASLVAAIPGDYQSDWARDPTIWGIITGIGVVLLLAGFVGVGLAVRRLRSIEIVGQMSGAGASSHRDGLAIASLVLGILGFYVITAVGALIFGYMAKQDIDRSGGQLVGRGMAIAGSILSGVWLSLLMFFVWANSSGLVR
jgi:hypothetical protein